MRVLTEETWTIIVKEDDDSQVALVDACRRAGFTPKLRYRIADREMRWGLIAAGRAISLCQPTSPHAEGTVLRPLAGDPLTGRIRLAWNRAALSENRAQLLYRAAGRAYLDSVPRNTFYRSWWASRPELHPSLD
ncbi:LysR substrate-binding domain-containing protein [Streptomyces sp. NPDC004266]|uniref:LysR substrate-binding domain-containing protein n=1 Tax=Streptomyces sp. NPDC004266 TaxID=3364693 RepID=UPI0036814C38